MKVIGSEDLQMPSGKKELKVFKKQKMPEWTQLCKYEKGDNRAGG